MAEPRPGRKGTITSGMPRSRASSTAYKGPAPPKATSAKSRGSWPRFTETRRIAPAMLARVTRKIPVAAFARE